MSWENLTIRELNSSSTYLFVPEFYITQSSLADSCVDILNCPLFIALLEQLLISIFACKLSLTVHPLEVDVEIFKVGQGLKI